MSPGPLAERRPGQLSGGEQQRVGLYLFDQPTAHLDASLRAQILEKVARRGRRRGHLRQPRRDRGAGHRRPGGRAPLGPDGPGRPARQVYTAPDELRTAGLTGPLSVLGAPVRAAGPAQYAIGIAGAVAIVPGTAAPAHPVGHRNPSDLIHPAGHENPAHPAGPAILVRPDWARLAAPDDPAGPARHGRRRQVPRPAHRPSAQHARRDAADPGSRTRPGPRGPVRSSLLGIRLMPRA